MLPGKIRFASLTAVAFFVLMATMTGQPPVGVKSAERQEVVQPKNADPRMRTLPAIIEPYETARIFAQIPGQCEHWNYDIGDRVKRGALLVKLYSPELATESRLAGTAIKQAELRIKVAKEFAAAAKAEVVAARAGVDAADSAIRSAQATVQLRKLQLIRMKDLVEKKTVERIALDEPQERHAVAVNAEVSSTFAWITAKAKLVLNDAKYNQAEANVEEAEADVLVAKIKYDQHHDRLHCRYIQAPFAGTVTQRNCAQDDFVQPGPSAGNQTPLFVMQRIDIVRVVIAIPERDVPSVKDGDAAEVEVAAYPGKKWPGEIQRMSGAVDPKTGCMRGEIHLRNEHESLRPGMSGTVSIRFAERK